MLYIWCPKTDNIARFVRYGTFALDLYILAHFISDMPTTAELTEKYILDHVSVKDCLKKGLINYSALARLIAKDLGIEKKTSREAILVAARRFRMKMNEVHHHENEILKLLKKSNVEIKNNIVIFTLEKYVYPDSLIEIEKVIKKEKALFFAIEGTKTITIIVQGQSAGLIEKHFRAHVLDKRECLSLFTITSPGIRTTPGVVTYISSMFFENDINIEEFMSCYDDTLIVIDSKDTNKVIKFLNF